MLSLWYFFIEKRQFTVLLTVSLLLAGAISAIAIPKESAPEVKVPIGIVTTILPGASAADMETLVTNELEDGLSGLQNLDKLTSTSREGVSTVVVEFDASADIERSIQDLKDAVDVVRPRLPSEAEDPVVSEVNFADQPVLIVAISGDYTPAELTRLGDDLQSRLERLQGVSRVEVSGVREREVQVVVNPEKLRQFGLRISDVVSAIQSANASLPVGSISVADVEYALTFEGDITEPSEVGDLALLSGGEVPVYVRDVADVTDGLSRAASQSRLSQDGEPSTPALTLSVFKTSGGNIVDVAATVRDELDALKNDGFIVGEVVVSFDAGEQVNKDLTELTEVGFETMLLVMAVLLLTIGWRESLIAGASIPISFLIAFIGLYASGNTINFVSLFSLILAIGILVDSGIVITEAIHTRMRQTGDKLLAAKESLREYAWPLIAGTMTTVAVFVPLFFLSGITGEFISSIPFTIIFVLLASIFVALGILPLIAILFTSTKQNRLEKRQEEYNVRIQAAYREFLSRLLDNRRAQNIFLWTMFAGFFVALALPITGLVKSVFFPGDNADFIYVEIEAAQGSTLGATDLATRAVEEILYENPDIESFVTTVGAGSSFSQSPRSGTSLGNVTILIKDGRTSADVVAALRDAFSQIRTADVRVFEPSGGPPSGAPVVVTFSGTDLDELQKAAARGEDLLASIEGTTEVQSSTSGIGLEFSLEVDKAKATALGLSPVAIAQTLRTSIQGVTATTIKTPQDDIDVVVKLALDPDYADASITNAATPDSVRNLSIETPQGPIVLGSVLTVTLQKNTPAIRHEDQKRIESISSYTEGRTTVEITDEFERRQDELKLPESVAMKIGGETEDIERSFREMGLAFIAGILGMFAILVLEFNSFRRTFYLLSVVPLSLIGVFLGLFITGQPLSFSSLLGVIALAGVIINHAIILLDSMERIHHERSTLSHRDTVIEAASSRLRAIILTTVTTVVGMIPLAGVSPLWGPLAFAIMFGLTFATLLTLVLLPILYYRWPGSLKAGSAA